MYARHLSKIPSMFRNSTTSISFGKIQNYQLNQLAILGEALEYTFAALIQL
jgi:hypothetical protein